MKINYLQLLLLTGIVTFLIGCTPAPLPPPAPYPTPAPFSCNVAGTPWAASNAFATLSGGTLNIVATDGGGGQVSFSFCGQTTVHTGVYQFERMSQPTVMPDNMATFIGGAFNNYTTGSMPTNYNYPLGSLTITSINTTTKRMSGIFNFYGYNAFDNSIKNISNGVFNDIPYMLGVTYPSLGNNSFSCKLDGDNFNAGYISAQANVVPNEITIAASFATLIDGKTVQLDIPTNVIPGSYDLTFSNLSPLAIRYNYIVGCDNFFFDPPQATPGKLIIISHDPVNKRIKGTFSANVLVSSQTPTQVTLTNGAFDLTYQ